VSIKPPLLICLCAIFFPSLSFGAVTQTIALENRSHSETELFQNYINNSFASIATIGKNVLPKRPLKIYIRPLFKGTNLKEEGLPIFDSLSAIENRAVQIFSKTKEIVLSSSSEEDLMSLNLDYVVHQLCGNTVVVWDLELMREFPLSSSPSSVTIEAPIWKDCRIQFFNAGAPLNEGRWAAFDDLLNTFCRLLAI